MKEVSVAIHSWDFCLFLLGVFHYEIFSTLKNIISSCDTDVFVIICWISLYIVISAIKRKNKFEH
jgi:hypothetical protein